MIDPTLGELLAAMPQMPPLNAETLAQIRPFAAVPPPAVLASPAATPTTAVSPDPIAASPAAVSPGPTAASPAAVSPGPTAASPAAAGSASIGWQETSISGPDGAPLPLTILRPAAASHAAPCVYWIHGGGMIMGNRYSQIDIPLEWLGEFGAVVVSVDYRLAPEARGSAPVDDCYQGLAWIFEHAEDLGVDAGRVVVAGASAGGGLAAGVTLMARDRGLGPIAGQVLIGPMLDHRNETTSSRQFSGRPGVWTREMNEFAWRCLLGDADAPAGADLSSAARTANRDGGAVSGYVSPAVAGDLAGLPPAYLDAGSAEVFRDEVVAYASRIWAAGGHAELHVWAGGFHGFDALFPDAPLSVAARRTRTAWVGRLWGPYRL
ncbi:alpha/beta hydrolase fold domain-containing protein [Paractinoplanes atraurantiacus]|uniref:Acetyl esterase/lipase n=1 Tax=Paractinoplanes atraurantiacus TaxID=1036182 RepID=A0A285HNG9_9ACTN|nr:alpha/beta hydrolase fold domain-containing protein [Actinoplanes atraurantiacus]SNY37265.1 Acetyl esterase/lipase [Actinoplanes atraurantiacus]